MSLLVLEWGPSRKPALRLRMWPSEAPLTGSMWGTACCWRLQRSSAQSACTSASQVQLQSSFVHFHTAATHISHMTPFCFFSHLAGWPNIIPLGWSTQLIPGSDLCSPWWRTGDKLLENKKHHELLEPYEQRAAAAVAYLKAVRPALTVQTGALLDPKVPTQHTAVTRIVQLKCIQEVLLTLVDWTHPRGRL